ncbi:cysteine hydrolase family protein [Natranaerobius thermophilus]|uniref:Isochorismatase hydrolase n=1 Tax=Natranaerobius thermophilus (strain ATCC BAA-1301 / DSM 18059 / JW/NM-WN-LF) TaxID=457570 RepID=B2A5Y3_NATTJ|nr:cysteine hydrolase [Natranaerobius thermophilus]ACB85400.1 isochorismatase hydrolase [Natranaerobius thermophilus JW/NM-WN-LF]
MDLNKSALCLIDIQKESKFGIENIDSVVENSKHLIEQCRKLNIPVIYTRHINRADGIGLSNNDPLDSSGKPIFYCTGTEAIEVIDEIAPKEEDVVIDKFRWSGFYETSLDIILKSLKVKHLMIGGLVTDGCLMTSVFDGYFRDYEINLIKDICATSNEGAHMAATLIMANWVYGIKIYDSSELIKKLQGKDYYVWESEGPDQLQFTPENMREVYGKLNQDANLIKQKS